MTDEEKAEIQEIGGINVHNDYMQFLCEHGAVGTLLLISILLGLLIPIFLLRYGFNSNWEVLFVDSSRRNIIAIPLIVDIVGFVLMTIPYFFWDYDSKKQNQVMEVLKRRAEVTEKSAAEANETVSGGYKG
mgnify:CR=1 FL=1